MVKQLLKKNWHLIVINILLLLCFILGYGRFGSIIVDSFREAYIPEQMLHGKMLYKDIFVIYCPLAYFINAFLMLIFGTKLKVLYLAGFFAATGIINLSFKIFTKFIQRKYAFCAILFIIAGSVLSANVFNLFFPYSFGILYGILFVLTSMYFALSGKFLPAYIFYSLAICSKYEFIFYLPVLIWMSGRKDLLKNLIGLFIPIAFTLGILFLQDVRFSDLVNAGIILIQICSTKTLYWFYSVTGLIFRPQIVILYFINFFKYFIPLILLKFIDKLWMAALVIIYLNYVINPEILIYIYPLLIILLIVRFKHLKRKELFIALSVIALSAKLFFAFTLQSYGVYFLPFALLGLFALTPPKFKKALSVIILCSALVTGAENIKALSSKNIKIQTEKGVVYYYPYDGKSINDLTNYIQKNTQKSDKVLVFPEALSVNYLTNRNSDEKLYSLIPLYVELFGDDAIINRLDLIKPEYIVITNSDMSNYYYQYFGLDYAEKVYKYILDNYTLEMQTDNNLLLNVFKRK